MASRAWPIVLALSAASCAVGPDFARPDAPKTSQYTRRGDPRATVVANGTSQRFVEQGRIAADWWRLFGSPKLDALVARAFADSPTLAAARASLERSRDQLRAGYGVFFPQIDANAGVSRERFNPAPGILPSSTFNFFTASGSVGYVLDVWGGERRTVEQLGAGVDVQRYTLEGSWVMLTGNIVVTVVAKAAYAEQIQATRVLIKAEEDEIRITEAQFKAGTVPYSNVLSIRTQIAQTRATLPALEQRMDQAAHLLATLTGRLPSKDDSLSIALSELTLPRDVPVSLPSDFVRQRPDVLAAEAQLHAANAAIGVATAQMLPTFRLDATYGSNAQDLDKLFSSNSMFGSIGGGITAPIFHGGSLYYGRKAAIAARDQSAALYRQAVLSAFAQVADTLRALEHDAEALRAETEAVESAEQALRLVAVSYEAGLSTYLQVLIANAQYENARLLEIAARAQRLQDTAQLYVALGGGWWNRPAEKR